MVMGGEEEKGEHSSSVVNREVSSQPAIAVSTVQSSSEEPSPPLLLGVPASHGRSDGASPAAA